VIEARQANGARTSLAASSLLLAVVLFCSQSLGGRPAIGTNSGTETIRIFAAKGVVRELKADKQTVVIAHEAISNYMDAMTMPFRAAEPKELVGLRGGDIISFRLAVSKDDSWIEHIEKTGQTTLPPADPERKQPAGNHHPLLDYHFTNELGHAVSLNQFRGQALAITFFFTRCPIPNYCPRLSKNFEEAAEQLNRTPDAPTNWHFLSVSFDTEFDTPAVLKAYGERYNYDPKHWSFLTGPKDKIAELAQSSDATFEAEGAFFNHNFRTLIIDTNGHLQTSFPIGGNLSDAIVKEILKAAGR
jgi:protein SCO1/2